VPWCSKAPVIVDRPAFRPSVVKEVQIQQTEPIQVPKEDVLLPYSRNLAPKTIDVEQPDVTSQQHATIHSQVGISGYQPGPRRFQGSDRDQSAAYPQWHIAASRQQNESVLRSNQGNHLSEPQAVPDVVPQITASPTRHSSRQQNATIPVTNVAPQTPISESLDTHKLATVTLPVQSVTVSHLPTNSAKQTTDLPPAEIAHDGNQAVVALLESADRYVKINQLDKAGAALERALRIEPRNAGIWHDLAQVRLHQGQYQQAESLATKSNNISGVNRLLQSKNWKLISSARRAAGNMAGAEEAEAYFSRLTR
jgi:tetratricopeptide (TPR) repeat protein